MTLTDSVFGKVDVSDWAIAVAYQHYAAGHEVGLVSYPEGDDIVRRLYCDPCRKEWS